jgi:hypothetical protein
MQEKYGVDFPLQNEEIMEKTRRTNKERYGVENVAAVTEVRIKMAQTTLEKYGVEHYNQLPEMKNYLRDNCTKWLAESYAAGGPAKGIVRPEEWNQKQRDSMTALILSGNWMGGGTKNCIKGHFLSDKCRKSRPYFRSRLEMLFHAHLEMCSDVEWYDYEPFHIPYQDDQGKQRNYIPDFLVKYKNRPNIVIVEIKPAFRMREAETDRKVEAGKLYAENLEMDFEYWCEKSIKALNIDEKSVMASGKVELL